MKPRSKPGKAITGGRAAREAIAKAKPLSASQMQHLKEEKITDSMSPKAGRGGQRAHWKLDYEEGVEFDKKPMPRKDSESTTMDGTRRWPKRGS